MKRVRSFLLVSMLMLVLILAGCGSSAPTSENKDSAAAGGPGTAAEETFELTFNYFGPEMIPPGHWSQEAAKRVEEKTNGRVKIKTYFSESLLKYGDTVTGTASGVADISFVDSGLLAGQYDLNMVFSRFVPEAPPQEASTKAYRELIKAVPELNKELEAKGLRWLSIFSTTGEHLHTVKKEVRVPADVKGMKVAVVGEPARWFESMGAAPVAVAAGDFYMSLERGLVDGQWAHWPAMNGFKLFEVTNNHSIFGKNGASLSFTGYIINLKTWNKLPADIQKIMMEAYDWAGDEIVKANAEEIGMAVNAAKAKGSKFIELKPEELKLWADTMDPINQAWIKATEAKKQPAQATFDKLFSLINQYK